MGAAVPRLMDADEFLQWSLGREGTWELVDGVPRLKRTSAMARTTIGHDRVRRNIDRALDSRLRGGPCEVFSEAVATRVSADRVRCPDVTVDCGGGRDSDLESCRPTVLFEIFSPSTRRIDVNTKPFEYRQVESLQHFVLVEPALAYCTLWSRQPDGTWRDQPVIGLGSTLGLTAIGVDLPLAEIYDGVTLGEE